MPVIEGRMIEFHEPTIADRAWMQPILYAAGFPGADYTFNNMYFWSEYYGEVGLAAGMLTQHKRYHGFDSYIYPAGTGDVRAALNEITLDARERGGKLRLRGLTNDTRAELESLYPGRFRFTSYRDSFDYIYTVEELSELRGKKLQAKRNHCNRFCAEHPDWYTQELTADNLPACRKLLDVWYESHPSSEPLAVEQQAISRALSNYEVLEMDGLLLYDGERLVGVSMGTRMNEAYYDVNFEKAFAEVDGAYAMINREFSRMIVRRYPGVQYLNREDDMGLEGLRKAKESYQPTLLLEKFVADEVNA